MNLQVSAAIAMKFDVAGGHLQKEEHIMSGHGFLAPFGFLRMLEAPGILRLRMLWTSPCLA